MANSYNKEPNQQFKVLTEFRNRIQCLAAVTGIPQAASHDDRTDNHPRCCSPVLLLPKIHLSTKEGSLACFQGCFILKSSTLRGPVATSPASSTEAGKGLLSSTCTIRRTAQATGKASLRVFYLSLMFLHDLHAFSAQVDPLTN